MSYPLPRSILVVVLFWTLVLLTVFGLSDPESNKAALAAVENTWGVSDQAVAFLAERVDIFNAYKVQLSVLGHWSGNVLLVIPLFVALGSLAGFFIFGIKHLRRAGRERAGIKWRGIQCTHGITPIAIQPSKVRLKLTLEGALADIYQTLPSSHQSLFIEVIEVLGAYGDSYVGDGHEGVTLLEHSLSTAERVANDLDIESFDKCLPIVAIAHDLGKIESYINIEGKWQRIRYHDDESARLIATLDAWDGLPEEVQSVIGAALRYSHKSDRLPLGIGFRDRIVSVMDAVKASDKKQTSVEKVSARVAVNVREAVWDFFRSELPHLPVSGSKVIYGSKNVLFWQKGKVFILEANLRERLINSPRIPGNLKAIFENESRELGAVSKLTEELLSNLDKEGILIRDSGDMKARDEVPLWNIKVGRVEYNAVIVVSINKLFESILETHGETGFDIEIQGPYGKTGMIDASLISGIGTKKRSVKKQGGVIGNKDNVTTPSVKREKAKDPFLTHLRAQKKRSNDSGEKNQTSKNRGAKRTLGLTSKASIDKGAESSTVQIKRDDKTIDKEIKDSAFCNDPEKLKEIGASTLKNEQKMAQFLASKRKLNRSA